MALGYKPNNLGDVGNLSNEEWLKCRKHGIKQVNGKPFLQTITVDGKQVQTVVHAEPGDEGYIEYTLGGSDVAVAAGVSNFSTPLQLYKKKKDLWTPPAPTNPDQLQMGHDFEDLAALWFARKTGATIINDTCMYQHPKYPWALADMDRRFILPDGRRGILEIKTTSFYCKEDWADESYPEKYEYQLRYYMGVDDCDVGAFICFWGMNPANDMAIRWVDRDLDKEEMIFGVGEDFIQLLENDAPPTMAGIKPEQAVAALAELYKGDKALPTIELGDTLLPQVKKIVDIDKKLADAENVVKAIKKQRTAFMVPIIETMKDHEVGEITDTNGEKLLIKYPLKITRRIDADKLRKEYPDVASEVVKESASRSMKIEPKKVV